MRISFSSGLDCQAGPMEHTGMKKRKRFGVAYFYRTRWNRHFARQEGALPDTA